MAEDKKKKTNTNKKVNTTKKTSTTKKVNNQNNKKKPVNKNTKQQPKKTTKKVATKEVETKKVAPKKVVKKEQPKKVEETKVKKVNLETPEVVEEPVVTEEIHKVIEVETDTTDEESFLEKTLIFDGRENKNLAEVVEKLEAENVVLEDKVIKRSKGKRIAVMVLIALIALTIVGTIGYVIYTEIERVNNNQTLNSNIFDKVSNRYDSIDDIDTEKKTDSDLVNENYKNIEDISLGQFEKKILSREDMIVIVTSSTCFYCAEYEPIVDEVFKSLNKTIYRINITALTDEENARFRTYYAYTTAPTIFTIKNGIVRKDLVGKKETEELEKWLNKNL